MNLRTRILAIRKAVQEGGPSSGNYGHSGRPGEVGGSGEGSGSADAGGASHYASVDVFASYMKDNFSELKITFGKTNKFGKNGEIKAIGSYGETRPEKFEYRFLFKDKNNSDAIIHEFGHFIDIRYDFYRSLMKTEGMNSVDPRLPEFAKKFREELSQFKKEDFVDADKGDEKVANFFHSYVTNYADTLKVAPIITNCFDKFVSQTPTLNNFLRFVKHKPVSEGSASSGNFGHSGRPGEVGGSGEGGGVDAGGVQKLSQEYLGSLASEAGKRFGLRKVSVQFDDSLKDLGAVDVMGLRIRIRPGREPKATLHTLAHELAHQRQITHSGWHKLSTERIYAFLLDRVKDVELVTESTPKESILEFARDLKRRGAVEPLVRRKV